MNEQDIYRLSLGTIRCIREVLANRSVSLAAERLGISQPAVSQHLARFERLSGIAIVARHGNSLVIKSESSRLLLDAALDVEHAITQMVQHANAAQLRLGMSECFAANYFSSERQLGEVDLHVRHFSRLKEAYSAGELDVVARTLSDDELDADHLASTGMVWVARQGWNLPPDDEELPVVLHGRGSPFAAAAEEALRKSGRPYRVVARIDDLLTLNESIKGGLGYTTSPKFLLEWLPKTVEVVDEGLPSLEDVKLGVVYRRKTLPDAAAHRMFWQIVSGLKHIEPAN